MAEGKSPEQIEAHHVFKQHKPRAVRVNLTDGTPKDIAIDDTEEQAAHGIVPCGTCGAPNHAFQLSASEPPWIQCGCTGRRTEVVLGRKGRDFITAHREAMIAAVNDGRVVPGRG